MITDAVISDTHNLLRPTVLEQLAGCDYILHGGDICRQEIVDRLRETAPLYVVRGNNDRDWAEQIPYTLDFTLEGVRFFMTHK
jgi:putative phosphoesterase